MLGMRRCLRQGLEQLDAGSHMADGFQMGRAVAGVFARPLPVRDGLLGAARRRIVLGHQFRLGLHERGEAGF
jgi:hypothetical protein